MRLPTRLALVGVGVLAGTLAVVAVVTYQVVLVTGRRDVDRALREELTTIRTTFPTLLAGSTPGGETPGGTTPATPAPTPDDLRRAAEQYLALHPGTSRHLTAITVDGTRLTTRTGPADLLELEEDGELPSGRPGRITTVDTPEGPVRVLHAPLVAGTETAGSAVIAGPLEEAREGAARALVGIAVAGVVGLVVGGAALTLATRRALRPVVDLAAAARGTGGTDLTARVPEPARDDEVGRLAREFNRMLDRISADAEHRRRLLGAVSHELRTPLAVARGHLELFETLDAPGGGTPDPAAAARLTSVLRGELDRLAVVTDDLEAIVEGDGSTRLTVGPVFVPDLLDELRHRIEGLGAATAVTLAPAPSVVVEADQHRLAQALLNLVTNAVTHTPPGTRVRVEAAVDGDMLRLDVVDDGPGIDPAIRDRIFEPFVTTRADGSTRGRGLGLAVVRSLVEAQRGAVELTSGPHGTQATLRLPLAPAGGAGA